MRHENNSVRHKIKKIHDGDVCGLTYAREAPPVVDEREVEDESGRDEDGGVEVLDLRRVDDGRDNEVAGRHEHDDGEHDGDLWGEGACVVNAYLTHGLL